MTRSYRIGWVLAATSALVAFGIACSGDESNEIETPKPTTATAAASATTSLASPTPTSFPTATMTATAAPSPTTATAALRVGEQAVLTALSGDSLHFRDGPGRSYGEVAHLLEGETVSLISGPQTDTDGAYIWWQVKSGDGSVGWIVEGPSDRSEHWLVPLGSIDPLPFRSFARSIQQAIDSRNVDFFWRTAASHEVTCTTESRNYVWGCQDVPDGTVVEVLHVWNPWEGSSYSENNYKLTVSGWLAAAQPDVSDAYGSGAARIYATSSFLSGTETEYHAIATEILGSGSSAERDVMVFAWQLQGGVWRHTWLYRGERWWDAGGYPPVAWLNGDCESQERACIDWQRWP